jgi:AbrB family looped-hinge helix DNA binding protein
VGILKVSSKRQITIPISVCKKLLINEGDHLLFDVQDEKIVLTRAPDNYAKHFRGISKGMYGKTAAEVDEYVAEERKSWE